MLRKIDIHLSKWKEQTDRKVLLIRGARQVGKTYSIRKFGKTFPSFIEINFEKEPEVKTFFKGSLDPDGICQKLAIYKKIIFEPGNTLLFFDEIQACPDALRSLRFFHEQMPHFHVVAAGSMLEFALEEIPSFGVGRITSLFMYPMSFLEFLRATGDGLLADHITETAITKPLDEVFHAKLLDRMRIHMILGGMPEVVEKYRTSGDVLQCQSILDDLLLTLRDDFGKYKKRAPVIKLNEVMNAVALQAGAKFKYSNISTETSAAGFKDALDLLVRAGLAYKIFHTSARGIPLGGQIDARKFKLLPLDTGILQRLCGLSLPQIIIKEPIRLINEGSLAETYAGLQMIAGAPANSPPGIYYWHRESRASNAEVDYVISSQSKIIGIEVKAAKSGSMQSLRRFLEEDIRRQGVRLSQENTARVGNIHVMPLYAAELLTRENIDL
jgi:predicted AAA+ superfamily ATPase